MPQGKTFVPALGYAFLTGLYDPVVALTTRERTFKLALMEQADIRTGQHVLDLACGTGTLAIWIKQRYPGAEISGLDGDEAILARARAKAARAGVSVRFDTGMSYALPYASASFDRAVCSLFFHHLQPVDKARTGAELLRVLKPGAELHVADWGKAANPLMRTLFYAIQILDGFPNTADNVAGRLPDIFRQAGFVDVTGTRAFSTVFGTMALYRARKPS